MLIAENLEHQGKYKNKVTYHLTLRLGQDSELLHKGDRKLKVQVSLCKKSSFQLLGAKL